MSQDQSTSGVQRPKSGKDRWVKLGFLGAVVIVALVLYMRQVQGPTLSADWGGNLDAALDTAKGSGQRVVVFFYSPRGSHEDNSFVIDSLMHSVSKNAIDNAKALRVQVAVGDPKAPLAARYALTALPAVAVLSPQGKLLDVRTGRVGHPSVMSLLNDTASEPATASRP